VADDLRPLTDAERRYLRWCAKHRTIGSSGVADLLLASCGGAGCLTCFAYLILGILWKAAAPASWKESGVIGLLMFVLPIVIWIGVLVYAFTSRRRRPPDAPDPRRQIEQDLSGGVAKIHRFRATAVLLAYDGDRSNRTYFVRLDDGRILFLASWKPPRYEDPEMSFLPDERGFPSAAFEIATGPGSLFILNVVGSGEYLRPQDEFELGDGPESSPRLQSGSFVQGPWEEIRKTYG
jgi:hypothetical protein